MSLEVANTIRAQIGPRALFMMGAKNLLGDESSLTFKISLCRKISHIRITLEPSDLYKVEFLKIVGFNAPKVVAEEVGIYADMLHRIIESNTGLALSL